MCYLIPQTFTEHLWHREGFGHRGIQQRVCLTSRGGGRRSVSRLREGGRGEMVGQQDQVGPYGA